MSLHSLYSRFPSHFPLPMLLDGATGTSLMREGMPSGVCPEAWVAEHPDVIASIQSDYYKAGSHAVFSPTFGCNRPSMTRHGLTDDIHERTRLLASLSRNLNAGLVGGDMSPTGLFLQPYGDATFDSLCEIYAEQTKALVEAGVDFLITETNISLAEARAAVLGAHSVSDLPVFATLTLDAGGRTISGDAPEAALLTLADCGIAAFGFNCSTGPDEMLSYLKPLVPLSLALGIPLIAKPNAGLPHEHPDGTRTFDLNADAFGEKMKAFPACGISILGGCCGTDASHIAALHTLLNECEVTLPAARDERPLELLACDAKTVVTFDPDGRTPSDADEDLFDSEDDCLFVSVKNTEDADFLLENAYLLPAPLAVTGDPDAVSRLKRGYCGKIVVTEA